MKTTHAPTARAVALDVLEAVLDAGRPLDDAIGDHPDLARLAVRDRAFARNLVATCLRRRGQIEALINHCLERPLQAKGRVASNLLRLGAGQLLFLATPPHAAVHETVSLALARGQGPYKGLINAVLRRLGREGPALVAAQDAARLNTPDWLWSAWEKAYGNAACRRIAEAHLGEPRLDLTVRSQAEHWAERLGGTVLPTGSVRCRPKGPIDRLEGYDDGAWWVQDAAASLPARLLGPVAGRRIIDLCAAPGGKTAQLAAAGARVIAVDRSEARLDRLRRNLERLHLSVEMVAASAETWRPDTPADAVLLDAPCSATGTIRRHPDVAWLKTADDVTGLGEPQSRLLGAAIEMVRPGGVIVYCVCSLQPEEGADRVRNFLASGAPVERSPVRPEEICGLDEMVDPAGALQSLPFHLGEDGGVDGFHAVRLTRLGPGT
jgi:16S rRNA (cytosine967-C5)-methyltransferase